MNDTLFGPELVSRLTEKCVTRLESRLGHPLSDSHKEAVMCTVTALLTAQPGSQTVIPLPMGYGKSTILATVVGELARTQPDFGCIIVKERVDDLKALRRELTDYDEFDEAITKYSYLWRGFSEDACRKGYSKEEYRRCPTCGQEDCPVKKARKAQGFYPVLLITHERLFRKANSDDLLNGMTEWVDRDGARHTRRFLFIDERPKFIPVSRFPTVDFAIFIEELRTLDKGSALGIDVDLIERRGRHYLAGMVEGKTNVLCDAEMVSQLKQVEGVWWRQYDGDKPELLSNFMCFFAQGGYLDRRKDGEKDSKKVTVSWVTDYVFKDYATVILDGTAAMDLTYPSNVIMAPLGKQPILMRDCSRVAVWNCSDMSLSMHTATREKLDKFVIPEVKRIQECGRTLVICHKKNEKYLREQLSGCRNVTIGHFNALKGSNDFRDCINVFFAGTLNFGDPYYAEKARRVIGSNSLSFEAKTLQRRHRFVDDRVDSIRANDMAVNRLQDIMRCVLRNPYYQEPVSVYMFEDAKVAEAVAQALPNSTLRKYELGVFDYGPSQTILIELIDEYFLTTGREVPKTELRSALSSAIGEEVSKQRFNELMKTKAVQEHLHLLGITGSEPGNMSRRLVRIG